MSRRRGHPEDHDLLLLAQDELPAAEAETIRAHLASCAECARQYEEWLRDHECLSAARLDMPDDVAIRFDRWLDDEEPAMAARRRRVRVLSVVGGMAAATVLVVATLWWVIPSRSTPPRVVDETRDTVVDNGQGPTDGRVPEPVPSDGDPVSPDEDQGAAPDDAAPPEEWAVSAPADSAPAPEHRGPRPHRHDAPRDDEVPPRVPRPGVSVRYASGAPQITRGDRILGAGPGASVQTGDRLETDDVARALLVLPDGGQVAVGYDSTVQLAPAPEGEPRRTEIGFIQGEVWAWSPGDGDEIRIHTRTGAARVHRGEAALRFLGHDLMADGPRRSVLDVVALQGHVSFEDAMGAQRLIPTGETAMVAPGAAASALRPQAVSRPFYVHTAWGRPSAVNIVPSLSGQELLSELDAARLVLGVRVMPLGEDEAGAEVVWLDPEGSGAQAGLRIGDVVIRSSGLAITNARDIAAVELLLPQEPEQRLTVRRDGQETAVLLPSAITAPRLRGPDDGQTAEVARLAAQGDPRAALSLAIGLCDQDPASASAWLNRGLLHEHLEEADDALHALKQTVQLAPESGPAHRALGRVYARLGNASRARTSLQQAASLTSSARDWYLLGKVLLLDMRASGALSCVDRILTMDDPTDRAWGHVLAGEVAAVDASDSSQAAAEFRSAAELDPSNMEATYHLARGRINAGDHDSAALMASILLQDNAISLRTLNLMTEVLYRQEQWDQAERWMDKAIAAHPTFSPALCNRGRIALKLGRPGEALPYYRQALAHDPTYALAHVGLGDIADARGDGGAAAEHYRLALELDPGESTALNRAVALCRRGGEMQLADELWARYHLVPHAG